MWIRRPIVWTIPVLAAALIAAVGYLPTEADAPDQPPAAAADHPTADAGRRLEWGFYHLRWTRGYGDALKQESDQFASPPDYIMFFVDLRWQYQKPRVDAIFAVDATPLISFELTHWHHGGGGESSYLPAINSGAYDEFFRRWAGAVQADGRRLVIRFGYEFNGNWFSWCQDPEGFVAAWKRIHGIFQEVGATHVEWAWSPNVVSRPDGPENDMHRYYPGDAYVDWIGVDGYNFGEHHDQWHRWESFEDVFREVLPDFAKRYPSKPVMITEFGSAPGKPGQRATWIREAYQTMRRFPQVKAAIWFNVDKRREGEPNWRLVQEDGSLAAFNETFARPAQEP